MKQHLWRIKEKYYQQLRHGKKDVEVRVGYSHTKKVQVGDLIVFEKHTQDIFKVNRIANYATFDELLKSEDPQRILPGATAAQALKIFKKIYPRNKERLGVYALELKLQK